jgi:hypothetical protein
VHAHLRHFVESEMPSHAAEIVLDPAGVGIPIVRHAYKSKPDSLGLLIRTSSVGRDRLHKIAGHLQSKGQSLKLRRSAKLRLLSQCNVCWPVSDATYPAQAVHILQVISGVLECPWPLELSIVYEAVEVNTSLPGVMDRGKAGNLGYSLGKMIGRIVRGP